MKKLRLHLDDLRVDTFDTHPGTRARGTVEGHEGTIFFPITPIYCTDVQAYSCYEDCTTQNEDLSCAPGCESITYYAPTCPECVDDAAAAGVVDTI
jgi:hypothetical protein